MAYLKVASSLVMLLVLLSTPAKGDDNLAPIFSPYFDNICNEVNCGKGSCHAAPGMPFGFTCQCDAGWKKTRYDDQGHQFLPCVVPNCTLDYTCMPAPPPSPEMPNNISVFDPCYWVYCGEGTCTKNDTYTHTCRCNSGNYNLLNITTFPCFSECAIGSECSSLGVTIASSSSAPGATPPGQVSISSQGSQASQATAFMPGIYHWISIFMIPMVMALWK